MQCWHSPRSSSLTGVANWGPCRACGSVIHACGIDNLGLSVRPRHSHTCLLDVGDVYRWGNFRIYTHHISQVLWLFLYAVTYCCIRRRKVYILNSRKSVNRSSWNLAWKNINRFNFARQFSPDRQRGGWVSSSSSSSSQTPQKLGRFFLLLSARLCTDHAEIWYKTVHYMFTFTSQIWA